MNRDQLVRFGNRLIQLRKSISIHGYYYKGFGPRITDIDMYDLLTRGDSILLTLNMSRTNNAPLVLSTHIPLCDIDNDLINEYLHHVTASTELIASDPARANAASMLADAKLDEIQREIVKIAQRTLDGMAIDAVIEDGEKEGWL